MILLRVSKILLDIDLKIILLDHQNDFVETLKIMSNVAKNFDILVTWAFYIIILIVQNYFSDYLYLAKILDLSAKPFFPYRTFSLLKFIDFRNFNAKLQFILKL